MERRRANARYWHLSVWLDPAIKNDVEGLAREEGLTVSGLVKHLLARALARRRAAARRNARASGADPVGSD